ncbi:MAG: PAS domain S-box protein [Candidatus Aegiribacteria sp.]|nr:PAS domain S-box protein [Candidatus Aegiribacteria sp.]
MNKMFFNSQGAGVFVVDSSTGGIIEANSTALRMLEMPATAVIGKLFSNFLRSADGKPLLISNEAVHGNLRIYRGRRIPVVISTVCCSIGKQKGFIHTFIKTKDRDTKKEDSSSDSEEKFKAISESTQDAIIMMNNEKQISFVNSTACRMFGYSADEMMGEDLHELIAPGKYIDSFRKGFESFRNSGEGIVLGRTLEIEARRKNGNIFPVELSVSSTKQHDGWHAIGIIKDITEKRNAEREIIAATEAAANASRTKSEFLANMSHEIRTPLNSIIGTLDLLTDTKPNEEQEYFIEFIRSSGNSLLELVNNILDISQMEAGKITLDIIPFNVRDSLNKVIDTLVPRAEKKGLALTCEISDDVPGYLSGDPDKLQQIIVNLVGNSIKFTESGSIKVFAESSEISGKKAVIRFSVLDTGIGIPPAKLESIFNSFSQADTSITRKFGGTGLGLTISKNLVHLMNGDITLDSQLDQGSTFSFTAEFDIHHELSDKKDSKTASDGPEKNTGRIMRDLRILLVDDSPDNRFLVKAFLRKESCLIVEAENGSEALEKYFIKNWDVILMDMQMPVMDGYTATARIREIEREKGLRHIPVVALTAHTINTEIRRCLDAGCDVHLAKPVSKNALIKLISEITHNVDNHDVE